MDSIDLVKIIESRKATLLAYGVRITRDRAAAEDARVECHALRSKLAAGPSSRCGNSAATAIAKLRGRSGYARITSP